MKLQNTAFMVTLRVIKHYSLSMSKNKFAATKILNKAFADNDKPMYASSNVSWATHPQHFSFLQPRGPLSLPLAYMSLS